MIDLRLRYTHTLGALRPYFDGLRAGEATASRCPACKRTWFPPRLVCPRDHTGTQWVRLSGRGRIVNATAGKARLPLAAVAGHHVFALVALDGADNVAFARLGVGQTVPAPGARVRLVRSPEAVPHPAQCAWFVPDDS